MKNFYVEIIFENGTRVGQVWLMMNLDEKSVILIYDNLKVQTLGEATIFVTNTQNNHCMPIVEFIYKHTSSIKDTQKSDNKSKN